MTKQVMMHTVALVLALLTAILTFQIYAEEASASERLIYAFIVGFSAWILLYVALWTFIWIFEGLKK